MSARRLAVLMLAFGAFAAFSADDLPFADFEGTNYGPWTVVGDAFGSRPAQGTLPNQMEVSGFTGHGLVNSYVHGDKAMGRLISPAFTIERKFIWFLIGGGGWPEQTCMNLVVSGQVVRTATGPNVVAGGSEALEPASWDVSALLGQAAHLEIVDEARGGWGHINVDQIVQSDRTAPLIVKPTTHERQLLLDRDYLLFPVGSGLKNTPKLIGSVLVDGEVIRQFDLELSEKPDWFAHLDVRAWKGRLAVVRIEKIAPESKAADLIRVSDELWNANQIYREPLRAQLHFSSRRGWNNDPNGMVFANGEYHLYYQHNPYGWPWGNMHWGHAVSRDMVHWHELPIALYPHAYGDWAFSGSAVVDRRNSSGWKQGSNDLIVAAFTSTRRGECIVYSTDGGRTFVEYTNNPVVKHAGRDPRLLWHEASHQWVMAVYDEFDGGQYIAFYASPDLKTWTFQSRIAGFYECPDLFPLGDKWVLTAASSEYMIGAFDGKTFTPETPKLKGHLGRGFYAAQTFSHDPQGRVIQIGWFQAATPGMPFNQSMSLPNELRFLPTPDGPRMTWTPVPELSALRATSLDVGPISLQPGDANPLAADRGELLEVRTEFTPGHAQQVSFSVRGAKIVYDVAKQQLIVNGHPARAPLREGKQRMAIFVDRTGLDVYASDGLTFVPMPFLAPPENQSLEVAVTGGTARFDVLQVHAFKSAW